VDPAIEAQQADRLAKLRAERDQAAVDAALADLKKAAEGTDNVLYPMKDARLSRAGPFRRTARAHGLRPGCARSSTPASAGSRGATC
ncbi:methylmalonyl-CoA mutase family protein, partial [Streptomyces sp. NPDC058412]|uniref:methylmalonyl-CoA mutase family protein n=1 Tax=Streptomyces sp. NPDC058412 TaxID=3346486 RepID=UPI003665260E